VELFYEVNQNFINLVPVFAGFVESDQTVRLSSEDREYRWVSPEESAAFLSFGHQTETMRMIEAKFVKQVPSEFLRVKTK